MKHIIAAMLLLGFSVFASAQDYYAPESPRIPEFGRWQPVQTPGPWYKRQGRGTRQALRLTHFGNSGRCRGARLVLSMSGMVIYGCRSIAVDAGK